MPLTATRSLNGCLPSTSGRRVSQRGAGTRLRDATVEARTSGGRTMFPALNTFHRRHNLSCLIPRRAGDEGKQSQQMRLRAILWGSVFSSSHCEGRKELASISICRRRRVPNSKSAQKSDFCEGAFNDYDVGPSPRVTRQPTPTDHA